MRHGWKVGFGGLVVLALSAPVFSQRTTGGLTGTVKDGTGAVLPGVTVDLTGEYVMGTQTSITNENGVYRFLNLSPGTYNLAFTLTGFAPFNRNGLVVSVGMTSEENVTLNLSSVAESVTVTGASPVVDTISSDIGTNYDKEWVTNAPVTRNSFHDFIASAPGVVSPTNDSARGNAMVYGSAVDDNSYQLDGTDVTDAFFGQSLATPNTDAIEEIEILSLGAPAEYGAVQGAVFNVVTKQGSNAFHGDANFYFQSDGLTDRNTTDEEDDGFPFHRDEYRDITAQLGGPITKDKLWFFGSFQYQRDGLSQVGVDPAIGTAADDRKRFLGKLNWQLNPQHRIVGTFHMDRIEGSIDYAPLPGDTPSTFRSKKNSTPTPGVGYTGLFGTNTVFDARYSGFYGDIDLGPALSEYPRTGPQFYNLDTGVNSGAPNYFYILDATKTTINAKLSHFADDFMAGSHDFKFGVQYGHAASGGIYGYNDYVIYYGEGDSRYGYGFDYQPFSYGGNTRSIGVFADDTFQVSDRLTLNLGVRFDSSHAYSPEQPQLNEDLSETGVVFPRADYYTWNTISPRLGFNLKLTGDGRTVLKGHWGRYNKTITTGDFSNIVGPSIPPIYFGTNFNFATNEFETLEIDRDNTKLNLDNDMTAPHTGQFILSVDRELTTDLGLSLIYINKRGRDFAAWQDLTGVYEQVPYVDSVGTDPSGETINVLRLVSDVEDRTFLMTNNEDMRTDIDAFTVQVTKRMSSNWQLTSALTYMKSEGRLGLSNTASTIQRSGLQFSSFGQNPNNFVNTYGRLPGDRPWTFKNQFVYQFPADFLVGMNLQYTEGAPRVRRIGINSVTGIATQILTAPRPDYGRLPSQLNLDLRIQKDFTLDDRGTRIGLFLDALNLLNEDAYEGVRSSIATSSSFNVPDAFLLPRRFMVGAKFVF